LGREREKQMRGKGDGGRVDDGFSTDDDYV